MTLAAFLPVFGVVLLAIGAAVAAMAVGVMFKRACLRGSCGGPDVQTAAGEPRSCASCPNRRRAGAADAAEAAEAADAG